MLAVPSAAVGCMECASTFCIEQGNSASRIACILSAQKIPQRPKAPRQAAHVDSAGSDNSKSSYGRVAAAAAAAEKQAVAGGPPPGPPKQLESAANILVGLSGQAHPAASSKQ